MLMTKVNRGRRSQPVTLPAPVGGLNGRDSLSEMPQSDAFVLDNWFPNSTSLDSRGGSKNFVTGAGAAVESLEVYAGGASSKMLAFANGNVYNASTAGAVGAALAAGRTSNKVTSTMFSNAGTQFLLIYSGADAPLSYDGTTLAALTYTGMTGSQNTLFQGMGFKGRLFVAQAGQLGFYYGAVGAIQGALSYFDLSQQSLKGGALALMASFSQESMGSGPQDYAVFATTAGEYIMYAGTDPSNAANWVLVGRYQGPPPIGKKGWFKFRSDVYFLTEEGLLSLTQIRQMGDEQETAKYVTSKLGRNFSDPTTAYQATHGWSCIIYPRGNAIVLNTPKGLTEADGYNQFLMNTNTNAWCRYTGWNGICWALFNKRMYFGTVDGRVVLADEGNDDNGVQIQASARQAWNTFDDQNGMGMADKQFHNVAFAVQADGVPSLTCNVNVNYADDPPTAVAAFAPPAGSAWDVSPWDTSAWAGASSTQEIAVSIGSIGYTASVWVVAQSAVSQIRWFATRIIVEKLKGILLQ